MLVSSLPKALVATQVNKAESVRSSFLILKSDRTPVGKISSRIVYLNGQREISTFTIQAQGFKFIGLSVLPRIAL